MYTLVHACTCNHLHSCVGTWNSMHVTREWRWAYSWLVPYNYNLEMVMWIISNYVAIASYTIPTIQKTLAVEKLDNFQATCNCQNFLPNITTSIVLPMASHLVTVCPSLLLRLLDLSLIILMAKHIVTVWAKTNIVCTSDLGDLMACKSVRKGAMISNLERWLSEAYFIIPVSLKPLCFS